MRIKQLLLSLRKCTKCKKIFHFDGFKVSAVLAVTEKDIRT